MERKDNSTVNNLIAKYLGGNSSKEETQELETWVCESRENEIYYKQLRNLWETAEQLPISTEKGLKEVMKRISNQTQELSFWYFWQRVAAVLLIPLLVSTLWLGFDKKPEITSSKPVYHKVVSAFGTLAMMELPDGSKVWLNAGSSLEYPDRFSEANRTVYLVGEAYFEVHSNIDSPFYVSTSSVTVKATGTRFSVMAYKDCPTPTVTLVEGKVSVLRSAKERKDNLITLLHPQQHMKYNISTEQVTINDEDPYKYIAWKDGKLVFRNDLLTDVVKRISLQYNVDIEIVGKQITKYRYRATFENEPLNELLRLLKISSPIDYREIKPELLPDGSFSRRKILIFSDNKTQKP